MYVIYSDHILHEFNVWKSSTFHQFNSGNRIQCHHFFKTTEIPFKSSKQRFHVFTLKLQILQSLLKRKLGNMSLVHVQSPSLDLHSGWHLLSFVQGHVESTNQAALSTGRSCCTRCRLQTVFFCCWLPRCFCFFYMEATPTSEVITKRWEGRPKAIHPKET